MSKRKLFLVEDDPTFAEMLKDYLSEKSIWDISHFNNGEACIERAFEEPFAAIIDYHLDSKVKGGINGMETLTQLKKKSPGTHCIFLSGQNRYGVALQTISHGAEQYIVKDDKAFATIREALEKLM